MKGRLLTADMTSAPRVLVIGSGISGMSAALHLSERGFQIEVLERDDQIGGRFGVDVLGDRPVMTGGKNIGHNYTEFRKVIDALGSHAWEPFGINASRVVDGEVVTLDSTHMFSSLRHTLQVASPLDIARLIKPAARILMNRANGFLDSPYFTELGRRRDEQPLSAHFGPKITRNLLRPMTIRMNGAEPDEVHLGTFGTNLSMLLDTYEQLTDGIQPVLAEFARRIQVTTSADVHGLIVTSGRVTGVRVEIDGVLTDRSCDAVVLATPAHAAAKLLRSTHERLSERLTRVRYFPSTVALIEYERPFFEPNVRALVMDGGPCTNVGAYGADDRHIARYTFSGRHARVEPTPETLEGWIDDAERLVAGYLEINPGRRAATITHYWPFAYCAYGPFYGDLLADVHSLMADIDGLDLCGDYLLGVNLEACSRSGVAAADRTAAYLRDVRIGRREISEPTLDA
jgi:protoporphyrinogen/coproporphyrinogen III oxidase